MAARSVDVYFENSLDTGLSLNPDSVVLDHGMWDIQPPQKIPKVQGGMPGKGHWMSESDGIATGTEGYCSYSFYDAASEQVFYIKLHWNDPFAGKNTYNIDTNCETVNVSFTDGAGDNATVTFKVAPK